MFGEIIAQARLSSGTSATRDTTTSPLKQPDMRLATLLLALCARHALAWEHAGGLASTSRRSAVTAAAATALSGMLPARARAAEPEPVAIRFLTDEEADAAARKRQLAQQQDIQRGGFASTLQGGIRSDYNPEAAANLRARSYADNVKSTLAKQDEMKKRNTKQKRDDLCEMLGRGC